MHSVFVKTLQTDNHKARVRGHEHDFDVQSAYDKVVTCCKKLTKASFNSSNLLNCIASNRMDAWKSIDKSFILHWQELIMLYD